MMSWATTGSSIVPTNEVPTWSAIVGMIGAAIGLNRDDDCLPDIARDYAMGIRVHAYGFKHADYHTVKSMSIRMAEITHPRTRLHELTPESLEVVNTSITRREYMYSADYQVYLVQLNPDSRWALPEMLVALRYPVYPLYAGRRSCLIGRLDARISNLQELHQATHWDQRIEINKPFSKIVERHDFLVGKRTFTFRKECVE